VDSSIGIGDLAALVTVAGATIYVLGLVGLAIPIYRTFTHDMPTTWYAVTLLPKIVVAGQGVRIWVQWPLVMTAAMLLIIWLLPAVPGIQFLVLVGFLVYVSVHARRGHKLSRIGAFISSGLAGAGGAIVSVGSVWLEEGVQLEFIMALFVGSFLIGLPMTLAANPPLPKVEISKHAGATMEGDSGAIKGYLVAHTDGFWHLLVENNQLLSIPDAHVLAVQTGGKVDVTPAEDTKPLFEEKERGSRWWEFWR